MDKIFEAVFYFFSRHKKTYWFVLVGITAILVFFATKIKLEEDITQMLPADEKTERSNLILRNTQFLDKLIINISLADTNAGSDPDALVAFADAFVDSLKQPNITTHFKDIQAQIDEETIFEIQNIIHRNLPFFLAKTDYATIDTLIAENQIDSSLQNNYNLLASPASMLLKQNIMRDPIGITNLALAKFRGLQPDDQYELYDGYIFSKGQRNIVIFLTSAYPPQETSGNAVLIEALNDQIKKFSEKDKAIKVSYFGTPAIAVANASQVKNDIAFTLSIALILIFLIIWLYFRNLAVLPVILLPAIFGSVFSLAIISLIKSKISVIALGAGTVVLGVAVDYSLHILVHYKHTGSMKTVIKDVSIATLVGCITTVGAFFCLLFVKAELLRDFGLFAGFTLMGAAIFSLIFLPHFVKAVLPQKEEKNLLAPEPSKTVGQNEKDFNISSSGLNKKIADFIADKLPNARYSKIWVTSVVILTGIFLYFSQFAGFESDMSKMNYMTPELKAAEKQLNAINTNAIKPIYVVFSGKNLDEALENSEKTFSKIRSLKELNDKIEFAGVSDILVSDKIQNDRLELWNSYWTNEKKQILESRLNQKAEAMGFRQNGFTRLSQLLDTNFQYINRTDLNTLKKKFLKDYINESSQLTTLLAAVKTSESSRQALVKILEQDENVVIADKQNLTARFVEIVNQELNTILTLSSLLVFFVLLISYGRFELAVITFIPMLVTWVWILGIMGLFGIKFNIINIIISTFIFGLGDDYSIFISDSLLNEYKSGKKHLSSFTISILLSATTTIIGVGVLIFATHPAIRSIALISVTGILCTVVVSYVLLPFLFKWLLLDRKKKALPPITLETLLRAVIAYSLFLIGCIVLTILGFILFTLLRYKKGKTKLFYHYLMMQLARILLFIVNVKVNLVKKTQEDFSTPAIIISNHQSFVDIIVLFALHPKIVFVTNEWVWNSPFFGNVVKFADFQSTAAPLEESFYHLSQKIEEGYSVLIFPEGTRSRNDKIGRFHKGAFYLSEKLNVDVLPVLVHGTSEIINRNDEILMKSGLVTLEVLPRIALANQHYGSDYAERSKKIKKYIENEFSDLKSRVETPAYFYKRLIYNYIYKGAIIEWYAKIKVKMEDEYSLMQSYVPLKANVVDIGCGYGFLAYLLSYRSNERIILGIDYDAEKIDVATNCHSKTEKVNFVNADALQYNFGKTDVFVLMDVLHYMEEQKQRELIIKCLQSLNNEGIIIIRDADTSEVKRHRTVAAFEFFSTRTGFNKSVDNNLHFVSSNSIFNIVNEYGASIEQVQYGKQTSNTTYIVKLNNE